MDNSKGNLSALVAPVQSVLDRKALQDALHDACIFLKDRHIDAFYRCLHLYNYPPLTTFVGLYRRSLRSGGGGGDNGLDGDSSNHSNGRSRHSNQTPSQTTFPPSLTTSTCPSPGASSNYSYSANTTTNTNTTTTTTNGSTNTNINTNINTNSSIPSTSRPTSKHPLPLLPEKLLDFVADPEHGFVTLASKVLETRQNSSGTAIKLTIQLQPENGGDKIETVVMRHLCPHHQSNGINKHHKHRHGRHKSKRSSHGQSNLDHDGNWLASVSVSTQSSCTITRCGFVLSDNNDDNDDNDDDDEHNDTSWSSNEQQRPHCRYNDASNLTSTEILEQVIHASRYLEEAGPPQRNGKTSPAPPHSKQKQQPCFFGHDPIHIPDSIRNVTFAGSGEPLLNYENVVSACTTLQDRHTWNLRPCPGGGQITIPTVGITPRIHTLVEDVPDVILSVGIRAPTPSLRAQYLPFANSKYPLPELLDSIRSFVRERAKHMARQRRERRQQQRLQLALPGVHSRSFDGDEFDHVGYMDGDGNGGMSGKDGIDETFLGRHLVEERHATIEYIMGTPSLCLVVGLSQQRIDAVVVLLFSHAIPPFAPLTPLFRTHERTNDTISFMQTHTQTYTRPYSRR